MSGNQTNDTLNIRGIKSLAESELSNQLQRKVTVEAQGELSDEDKARGYSWTVMLKVE